MKLLTKICDKLALVTAWFGVVCIAAMMILTSIDLVMRSVFQVSITGLIEVMQVLFCITLFSGLAYCQTKHNHIHVTLIVPKLPGKSKYLLWGIISLVDAITGIVVTVACVMQTQVIQGRYTMLLWIPFYPIYIFASICMAVFSLCLLLDAAKSFAALFSEEYAAEVSGTWVS